MLLGGATTSALYNPPRPHSISCSSTPSSSSPRSSPPTSPASSANVTTRQGRGRGRGRGYMARGRSQGCGVAPQSQVQDCVQQHRHAGEANTLTWSSSHADSVTSSTFAYSGRVPAPIGAAVAIINPVDHFHLFMTSEFYDELLVQTNLYANQQREAKNDMTPWTPISREELLAFIGINIAMGIVSLPTLNDCWSSDPILAHT